MICRACHHIEMASVLDLGQQPLANRLLTDAQLDEPEPTYPLHLVRCTTCGLCQLSYVVSPTVLYGPSYPYRSGTSEGWKQHCRELAEEIGRDKWVLDIGCLDAVLLKECAKNHCGIVGCDPSADPEPWVVNQLFGRGTRLGGEYDVIVAQNVIGHVDDIHGFLEGVRANLAPGGIVILECPWVVPLIEGRRWDTIYHEHLSYWSVGALNHAAQHVQLQVFDVKHFPDLHGGTVRFYLRLPEHLWGGVAYGHTSSPAVKEAIERESKLTEKAYRDFAANVGLQIRWWQDYFLNPYGKVLAGFGASAKGSTFLNALWVRPPLVGIFDDTPSKQGLFTPGHHYPILLPTKMVMKECEELILLAGNWHAQLEERARSLGFTGKTRTLWAA